MLDADIIMLLLIKAVAFAVIVLAESLANVAFETLALTDLSVSR